MRDKPTGEPAWRVARKCDGGACVQVGMARAQGSILLRSAADPDGRCVTVSRDGWREFVARVKDGTFDHT